MKKIIISCLIISLMAFISAGCNGIHITFGPNDEATQSEVKQEQNVENKSVAAEDKTTKGEAKQNQNTDEKPTVSVTINEVPQINKSPEIVVIKEQTPIYVPSGSFIFPNSDRTYLTQNQVASLTNDQLGIARNEIYARHGYIFSTEKYNVYFKAQRWYTPTTKNVTLNSIETYNVELIKAEESRRGIK